MPLGTTLRVLALAGASAVSLGLATRTADAGPLTIERPGLHPTYSAEIEPHGLIGILNPPGAAHGNGYGFGARGTFTIVSNGFIDSINNSVGIGLGVDWLHYSKGDNACDRDNNPGGNCDVFNDEDEGVPFIVFPLVLQWNFWLSRDWSVFAEPGLALSHRSNGRESELGLDPFVLYLGGRWHFSDYISLTLRMGYPTFSAGISFLL